MITTLDSYRLTRRSKALACAIDRVLTTHQLVMVREFMLAENPSNQKPTPEQVMFFLRLNMPLAAGKIWDIVHA